MKRTALWVATYYLGGGTTAAVVAAGMNLGILFVGFALAVLYLGHLWWTMLQAKRRLRGARACLLCQKEINRRGADCPFCCEEHQSRWLYELDEIAVRRLQAARYGAYEPMEVPNRVVREEMGSENDDLALVLANVPAC
jgi:hypothetical protein